MSDLVRVTACGLVALSCPKCAALERDLSSAFARRGIGLDFDIIVWDFFPHEAGSIALEHGIDDIPAFVIGGKVFKDGFRDSDVDLAAEALG